MADVSTKKLSPAVVHYGLGVRQRAKRSSIRPVAEKSAGSHIHHFCHTICPSLFRRHINEQLLFSTTPNLIPGGPMAAVFLELMLLCSFIITSNANLNVLLPTIINETSFICSHNFLVKQTKPVYKVFKSD